MKHFIAFAILFLGSLSVSAQEAPVVGEYSFHYQVFARKDSLSRDTTTHRFFVQGFQYSKSQENCGGWGWVYYEAGYTSFVFGPFCDLGNYFSVGAGLGSEFYDEDGVGHTLGRYALTAFFGTEVSNLELYYENGRSKLSWYRVDLQLYGNDRFTLGGIAQTGDGAGPRLKISLPLSSTFDLRIWGAKMYNSERGGVLAGIEIVGAVRERR